MNLKQKKLYPQVKESLTRKLKRPPLSEEIAAELAMDLQEVCDFEKAKLYCTQCGDELKRKESDGIFDRLTGKKTTVFTWSCPMVGHDSLEDREYQEEIKRLMFLAKAERKEREYNEREEKAEALVKQIKALGFKVTITD